MQTNKNGVLTNEILMNKNQNYNKDLIIKIQQ